MGDYFEWVIELGSLKYNHEFDKHEFRNKVDYYGEHYTASATYTEPKAYYKANETINITTTVKRSETEKLSRNGTGEGLTAGFWAGPHTIDNINYTQRPLRVTATTQTPFTSSSTTARRTRSSTIRPRATSTALSLTRKILP